MRFAHSFGARFATNGAAYGRRAVCCISFVIVPSFVTFVLFVATPRVSFVAGV